MLQIAFFFLDWLVFKSLIHYVEEHLHLKHKLLEWRLFNVIISSEFPLTHERVTLYCGLYRKFWWHWHLNSGVFCLAEFWYHVKWPAHGIFGLLKWGSHLCWKMACKVLGVCKWSRHLYWKGHAKSWDLGVSPSGIGFLGLKIKLKFYIYLKGI